MSADARSGASSSKRLWRRRRAPILVTAAAILVIVILGRAPSVAAPSDSKRSAIPVDAEVPAAFDRSAIASVSLVLRIPTTTPKRLLFVDGSCMYSMNELLKILYADTLVKSEIGMVYLPQVKRDPTAELETASLECARRVGLLHPYVRHRNVVLSEGRRPILESAIAAGVTDTLSFQRCVVSDDVRHVLDSHRRSVSGIQIPVLPLLSTGDSSWVGDHIGRFLRLSQ